MTKKNAKSSWSTSVKKAYDDGKKVAEVITHTPVRYEPRNKYDPQPWLSSNGFRYTGRECYLPEE